MPLESVKVPEGMEPLFRQAEELVSRFFRARKDDPGRGTIEIFGERYVLVRAASLSVEFFSTVQDLYGPGREAEADSFARNILFDLAHAIGKSDAQNFQARMNLTDPIARLSAGPVHFAYSGWAFVDIFPESSPTPDENYCLVYDHPYSFESDAWVRAGKRRDFPVCIMSAGYSSGWCEESFGLQLVASEILCRARGDDQCRFLMAHPARIEEFVTRYMEREPQVASRVGRYEIPDFFARKRAEEELRERVEQRTAELRASEQKLRQAHKLEAVGRLAGGIAHDFNNLMSIILIRGGLLSRRLPEGDATRREIDEIVAAASRASDLTQQLLAFSRAQVLRREPVDLAAVVTALSQSLLPLVGEHIELTVLAGWDPQVVDADRSQLEQVVINLVVNARDAMPGGGRLRIECGSATLRDPQTVTTGELPPGDYVTLTVEDSGSGMDEATLANIFDPFFTTKPMGSGSGLGLATVCGVVQQMGGEIQVVTAPEAGARFVLYLPRSASAAPEAQRAAARGIDRGHETVLLVEDQDQLRETLTEVLTELGYIVLAAADPESALELVERHGDRIGALVTDVVLPRMSGRELSARVHERRPGLPVVYMSGYAPDEELRRAVEGGAVAYLQKPFHVEALVAKLRELITAGARSSR